jgi:hypothetical protein
MVSSFFFFCPPRLPRSVAVFCYRSLFIYFVVRALTLDTFPCLAFPLQDEGSFFLFSLKLGLPFFKYVLLPRSILDGSVSLQVFLVISAGGEPASFHLSLTKKNNNNNGRREKKNVQSGQTAALLSRCFAGSLSLSSSQIPSAAVHICAHTHTHTNIRTSSQTHLGYGAKAPYPPPLPLQTHAHACVLSKLFAILSFLFASNCAIPTWL